MYAVLDLKDAFLHVLMSGKLYHLVLNVLHEH